MSASAEERTEALRALLKEWQRLVEPIVRREGYTDVSFGCFMQRTCKSGEVEPFEYTLAGGDKIEIKWPWK